MVVPFSISYNLLLSHYLQHNAKERIEDTTCKAKEKKQKTNPYLLAIKTSLNPYLLATKNIKKTSLVSLQRMPSYEKKISFCKYLTAL